MRNRFAFFRCMITAGAVAIVTLLPFSPIMAQDAMSSSPASSSSSSGETMSGKTGDTWITTKVKSELVDAKDVKSTDISVTTTEGVVVLTGTVSSPQQKKHVIHVARMVKGVKSVDASNLHVAAVDRSAGGQ